MELEPTAIGFRGPRTMGSRMGRYTRVAICLVAVIIFSGCIPKDAVNLITNRENAGT